MHLNDPSKFWQVPGEHVPGSATHSLVSLGSGENQERFRILSYLWQQKIKKDGRVLYYFLFLWQLIA